MKLLGFNPMPWQEHAADVIGEINPVTGHYKHPMIVISVPRQAGKSALLMSVAIHRALTLRNARVWYTAQTGQDASDQWKEAVQVLQRSPLRGAFQVRRANGSQEMWVSHGGRFSPHPPTEKKLHGKQSDLNLIDEGWAFDEADANALMQAIVPTQNSRPGAQIIVASTMGTARSTWFHGLVDRGRAGDPGIALLDWGVDPADDITDLAIVAKAHPAMGFTFDMERLEQARAKMPNAAEFARGYGNRATGAIERLIPLDGWQAAQSHDPIPTDARVSFGAAVDVDRTETAIAAAWVDDTGTPMLEIIECRPGTSWAIDRIKHLATKHDHGGICIDQVGPSGPLFDALTREGVELEKVTPRELTAASAEFYDRIIQQPVQLKIRPHGDLDRAAEIVTRRHLGDAWTWSRRDSAGSIAALEAATLAMHMAQHQPAPPIPAGIRF